MIAINIIFLKDGILLPTPEATFQNIFLLKFVTKEMQELSLQGGKHHRMVKN